MRWFKPNLRNSLHAIFSSSLGSSRDEAEPDTIVTIEDIRHRMLDLLAAEESERANTVRRRIRYAVSVESLWFMRGELMAVLSHFLSGLHTE